MSSGVPSDRLILATVEAMFEYLERVEEELGKANRLDPELRSGLGLPKYRFVDRSCATAVFLAAHP